MVTLSRQHQFGSVLVAGFLLLGALAEFWH